MASFGVEDVLTSLASSPQGKPRAFSPFSTLSQANTTSPCSPTLSLSDPDIKSGRWPVRSLSGVSTEAPEEHEGEETKLEGTENQSVLVSPPAPSSQSDSFEDWLERLLHVDQGVHASEPQEFLIENRNLSANTIGLAYRFSKDPEDRDREVPGPSWGSTVRGIDCGDGWLQVGARFLPMQLHGRSVVFDPATFPTAPRGPALTAMGRAMNFEDGSVVTFAHDKANAEGARWARELKVRHHTLLAVRRASAAYEAAARVEHGDVVSLNSAGIVFGDLPSRNEGSSLAERAKIFHRKLQRRRATQTTLGSEMPLCTGPDGKVFLLLPVLSSVKDMQRVWRKRQRVKFSQKELAEETAPVVIDGHGVAYN